ncbi:ATP-binding protein [Nocardioides caeni]|uniref:ATP-binding protein n=2 Tax=Nocardioides caeni TaxID=574700 RepID=A0A4S8N440_9ACTN|nr:ATP-binding protein [Nocardioides caeni]
MPRDAESALRRELGRSAVVHLQGPRQIGKTALARSIAEDWPGGASYLDLENPRDLARLEDAGSYLRRLSGRLVIIDEAQRMPELFEILRGVVDDNRRSGHRHGQFLLLGSASLDLVELTESLAGRITYLELSGVTALEVAASGISTDDLWVRGGYPESLIAASLEDSLAWRAAAVETYLRRDIPTFAPRVPTETLRRLWTMVAHGSGGLLNATRLAEGLGVSGQSVDRYLDLMHELFLVRRLPPWFVNVGKRVTKAPKIHIRDSGLLHALLGLESFEDVLGHPAAGSSWESFVVENVITTLGPTFRPHHYRTARGDEVDLVLEKGGRPVLAVEVKRSTVPAVGAGLRRARADLGDPETWVVHPDTPDAPFERDGITVGGLAAFLGRCREF